MKKALKIIGITLGGLVALFIIIGIIAVNSENKKEATTAAYTQEDKAAITSFAKSEMDYWQRAIDGKVIEFDTQKPYKYVDLVTTHFYMSRSNQIENSKNYETYHEIRELLKVEKEMAHTLPQGKGSYISQEQEQHIQEFFTKAQDLINTMGGLENE